MLKSHFYIIKLKRLYTFINLKNMKTILIKFIILKKRFTNKSNYLEFNIILYLSFFKNSNIVF